MIKGRVQQWGLDMHLGAGRLGGMPMQEAPVKPEDYKYSCQTSLTALIRLIYAIAHARAIQS